MNIVELIVRLSSIIFLGLGVVAWIVFTIGFGEYVKQQKKFDRDYDPGDDATLYAFWAASVIGPVVHALAVVHALMFFNNVITLIGRIIGSITALLFLIYITAIGYVMIGMCIFIGLSDGEVEGPFKDSINLLFAGGLLTTVFWGLHMAFWPWFNFGGSGGSTSRHALLKE